MKQLNYQALGKRIKATRQQHHLTQEQLGEACGLSTAHIGHIERGTRIPSLEALFAIACKLDVSIDHLLLDSVDDQNQVFAAITASLNGKDPVKVNRYLITIKALADKIDDFI